MDSNYVVWVVGLLLLGSFLASRNIEVASLASGLMYFILVFFQYNDNNGNPYSDVFWLSALVQSVGELEFGQQVHKLFFSC